jgi:hypothetical protein
MLLKGWNLFSGARKGLSTDCCASGPYSVHVGGSREVGCVRLLSKESRGERTNCLQHGFEREWDQFFCFVVFWGGEEGRLDFLGGKEEARAGGLPWE